VLAAATRGEEGVDGSGDRGTVSARETRRHDCTGAKGPGGWNGTRQGYPEKVPALPAAVGQTLVRRHEKTPANPEEAS